MRYPNVTSLCFATPLAINDPDGGARDSGFPGTISVKVAWRSKEDG